MHRKREPEAALIATAEQLDHHDVDGVPDDDVDDDDGDDDDDDERLPNLESFAEAPETSPEHHCCQPAVLGNSKTKNWRVLQPAVRDSSRKIEGASARNNCSETHHYLFAMKPCKSMRFIVVKQSRMNDHEHRW